MPGEVERGLKTERRIGPRAYLSPGGAFAGGTLARDVVFLEGLAERTAVRTPLLAGVRESNAHHKDWVRRRADRRARRSARHLRGGLGPDLQAGDRHAPAIGKRGALPVAGVAGSGRRALTIRRSTRCPRIFGRPCVSRRTPLAAASGASALVVATEWPEFRSVPADALVATMRSPIVCDASRFLAASLGDDPRIRRHRRPAAQADFPRSRLPKSQLPKKPTPKRAKTMSGALAGRAALITGANQGLGLAIARAYVREAAPVCSSARATRSSWSRHVRKSRPTPAPDSSLTPIPADVSRAADVERARRAGVHALPAAAHPRQQRRRLRPDGARSKGGLGRLGPGDRDQPVRVGAAVSARCCRTSSSTVTARSCSSPAAAPPIRCRGSARTPRRRRRSSASPKRWR